MPQFDTSVFAGQIFWMLFSFGFLYLMMSQLICPMIEEVLSARADQIQTDISTAERLNREAESLHQRHQTYILAAEREKTDRIRTAYEQIQKKATAAANRHESQLRRKVKQAEERIDKAARILRQESETVSTRLSDDLTRQLLSWKEEA